jgi:hypothetical protein
MARRLPAPSDVPHFAPVAAARLVFSRGGAEIAENG